MTTYASIKSLAPKPSVYQLKHPITGDAVFAPNGEPVTITLLSTYSQPVFNASMNMARKVVAQGKNEIDPQMALDERCAMIAASISNWAPEEFFGGKCTKKAALDFVKDPEYGLFVQQIEIHLSELENFF